MYRAPRSETSSTREVIHRPHLTPHPTALDPDSRAQWLAQQARKVALLTGGYSADQNAIDGFVTATRSLRQALDTYNESYWDMQAWLELVENGWRQTSRRAPPHRPPRPTRRRGPPLCTPERGHGRRLGASSKPALGHSQNGEFRGFHRFAFSSRHGSSGSIPSRSGRSRSAVPVSRRRWPQHP